MSEHCQAFSANRFRKYFCHQGVSILSTYFCPQNVLGGKYIFMLSILRSGTFVHRSKFIFPHGIDSINFKKTVTCNVVNTYIHTLTKDPTDCVSVSHVKYLHQMCLKPAAFQTPIYVSSISPSLFPSIP